MKKPLIILTGPTAVGKTALSINLAKTVNAAIISADSMQVYKGMDIGTAKILPEEMMGVKHYLIDEFEPDHAFNVAEFKELSNKYMDEIYAKGQIPMIVGGTGFYIQSVLYDIDFTENGEDKSYRKELEILAREKGPYYLHKMLEQVDPKSAEAIHANNVKRVIRALEFYKETGSLISDHNESERQKKSPYNAIYFVLNDKRERLYERIDKRIDIMLADGLVDEVKTLQAAGYTKDMVSMKGLGYKEILSYLEGECSLDEAIYTLKRDTRHFAKRQITWFKRERDVVWLNKDEYDYNEDRILENIVNTLKDRKII